MSEGQRRRGGARSGPRALGLVKTPKGTARWQPRGTRRGTAYPWERSQGTGSACRCPGVTPAAGSTAPWVSVWGAPLRFQGDLHTAEGDHKVTTLRNLDEDKLPATEKPRGVSCLQVSRDDTGGGTRRTRSFDVPHEEGMGPLGSGPPGLSAARMGDPYEGSMGPLGPGPLVNAARVGERRDFPRAPEGPPRTPREASHGHAATGGVPKGNGTTTRNGEAKGDVLLAGVGD